ncbi:polysaccharide deacetylase family protein [Paenibacillus hexagrammi]|uniref:Polysaccharide deacetylase family protein n=1 Tax=Paenibacillus hexagrammi TaxID=2908839 RepID=A0ABY3SJ56_9BACL|nr:polysaccharide deacetylase family protein [Paenibacillus sp. YPD9-1]UJF33971.1 polysaccharide deacetylase family protein [Paenibacillus sp. YPD9-1]
MKSVLTVILGFSALYTLVPWFLTRILGVGVVRRGAGEKEIAFTFDDGPNPAYTPRLLDLLNQYGVKATFFVLGAKAEAYPEIIQRMHREGHQIGVHNYVHRANWFMLPWTVHKQVDRTSRVVERLTGERPSYYRPPWGVLNGCDFMWKRGHTFVLWSLMAHDWRSRTGKNTLKDKLQSRMEDGSIILLHDCGETFGADREAPAAMLVALAEVLEEQRGQGFRYVRIDELHTSDTVSVHVEQRASASKVM